MFDRQLIDYLPPALRKVLDFEAITSAQQPEIEAAWAALELVMNNQFIDSATEAGVSVWERELNIAPLVSDTLDARKQRIKAAWAYGIVYTYNWLVDWLKKACGEENPPPVVDGYVLRATVSSSVDHKRIFDDMRRYVPSNMIIEPHVMLRKVTMPHYAGSALWLAKKQTITMEPWYPEEE